MLSPVLYNTLGKGRNREEGYARLLHAEETIFFWA